MPVGGVFSIWRLDGVGMINTQTEVKNASSRYDRDVMADVAKDLSLKAGRLGTLAANALDEAKKQDGKQRAETINRVSVLMGISARIALEADSVMGLIMVDGVTHG